MFRILASVVTVFLVAAAPLAGGPAFARELSSVERHALAGTVARFDAAMRRKDVSAIIGIIPPRVVAHIAAQHGIDPARLRSMMPWIREKVLVDKN